VICDRTIGLARDLGSRRSGGRVFSYYGVHCSSVVLFAGCLLCYSSSSYGEKLPPKRGLLSGNSKSTTQRMGSADADKIIRYILGSYDETKQTENPTGPDSS